MSQYVAEVEQYQAEMEAWRSDREAGLRQPDGWLSLAGLFVLQEGTFTLGSAESNQIVLPASAPAQLGTLVYADGKVVFQVNTTDVKVPVLVEGAPIWEVVLVDNRNGQVPTWVRVGSVSFHLHRFGEEVALRVRDRDSEAIRDFQGCKWYPIAPDYRVVGQLARLADVSPIAVKTSVKTDAYYQNVGAVEFELLGQPMRLLASATAKPSELFIIFRDATAGKSTYGAGRYLYAEVDADNQVILDFNKAFNPPCSMTPYATCSLPPAENVLSVKIEAGELY